LNGLRSSTYEPFAKYCLEAMSTRRVQGRLAELTAIASGNKAETRIAVPVVAGEGFEPPTLGL
jgi:hypothetical protein